MGQAESKESEHNQNHELRHGGRPASHGGETRTRRPTPPIAGSGGRQLRTPRTPATPGKQGQRLHGNAIGTFPKSAGPLASNRPVSTPSAAGLTQPKFQTASPVRRATRLQQQFAVRPESKTPQAIPKNVAASSRPRSLPIPINPRPRGRSPARRAAPPSKSSALTAENDAEAAERPAKRATRSRAAKLNDDLKPTDRATPARAQTSKNDESDPPEPESRPLESRSPFEEPSMSNPQSVGSDGDEKMAAGSESDDSDAESDSGSVDSLDDMDEDVDQPVGSLDEGDEDRTDESTESDLSEVKPAAKSRSASDALEESFGLRRSRRRSVPVRRLQIDPHRIVYVSI